MIRNLKKSNPAFFGCISPAGPNPSKRAAPAGRGVILAALLVLLFAGTREVQGQTETVLYSFGSHPADGINPHLYETLLLDKQGNLYGTTQIGGSYGYGTVFKLTPDGDETVLYSFGSRVGDGLYPLTGLVQDKKGNIYGTTYAGGTGAGTVFKLNRFGAETVLYTFGSQPGDGYFPEGALVLDKRDTLYGTTLNGSTVFELSPIGTETVLHSFNLPGDGIYPHAKLVFDKQGNLYGTTSEGGAYGYGTVFEVTPTGIETVLYSFGKQPLDGRNPYAGVILDRQGNLYGTTGYGGAYSRGTVFKLSATGIETVLYSFGGKTGDGSYPYAGVIFDKLGNLYGVTHNGGDYGFGTAFELSPTGTETVLHSFGAGTDGISPNGLVIDNHGDLYGTTGLGGTYGYGTVFKLTP